MTSPTAWDHVLAVLCGVVVPALGVWQQRKLAAEGGDGGIGPFATGEKIAFYWSNAAVLWVLAGAVVLVWMRAGRSLAELGLTAVPDRWAAGSALAGAVLLLYALDVAWSLGPPRRRAEARARWRRDTPFLPETQREMGHALLLVTSAAVGEEVVFRGFLVAWVASFTGSSLGGLAVAVVAPALVFAACHAYQGAHAMAKIAAGAVLFATLLVVTGSLWLPIALHFVVDLAGSSIGLLLMRGAAGRGGASADTNWGAEGKESAPDGR